MRFIPTTALPVAAVAMALLILQPAGAAGSQKSDPVGIPLSQEDIQKLAAQVVDGTVSCNLGISEPAPFISIVYIIPPNDQFYSFMKPGQCPACAGANVARLQRIHVVLDFRRPCTIPIQYSIVANSGTEACPYPNPNAQFCLTQSANLTATEAGAFDFALDLPDSCKFTDAAFLAVNFVSFPSACNNPNPDPVIGTTPMLVLVTGCTQCRSYNFFEGEQDDVCVEPDALSGNPLMYSEAWSCYVPNLRKSWGSLKIRYR